MEWHIMFSENYEVVFKWLENQIRSGKSESIFSNTKSAERAFKKLETDLIVSDENRSDLDHFLSVHLNKSGVVKLKTTVRIFKKREAEKSQSLQLLQCTLYASSNTKLDKLVEVSGKTKMEIINQLILGSDISEFTISTEEQLDLLV